MNDNVDRINEAYYGYIFPKKTQVELRNRVHWICNQVEGEKVLDVGCSQGIVSILLGREGYSVVGVDIKQKSIDYALSELAKENENVQKRVKFICSDIYSVTFNDNGFDTIILGEILEHLVKPEKMIEISYNLLRNGGKIIITTPFGVLKHLDHKKTFYLSSFIKLVIGRFSIDKLEIIGKRICFVGKKREKIIKMKDEILQQIAMDLLIKTEAVFEDIELNYISINDDRKKIIEEKINVINELKKKEIDFKKLIEELNMEKQGIEIKLEETIKEKKEKELKLVSKLSKLSKEKDLLQLKLYELQEKRQDEKILLIKKIEVLNKIRQQLKQEIARKCSEKQEIENKFNKQINDLHKQIEDLRNKLKHEIMKCRKYQEDMNNKEKEILTLRENIEKLSNMIKEKENQYEKLIKQNIQKINKLISENERLKLQYKKLVESQNKLEKQIDKVKNTVRYKIGDVFVEASKSPSKILALPYELIKLYKEGRKKVAEREARKKRQINKEILSSESISRVIEKKLSLQTKTSGVKNEVNTKEVETNNIQIKKDNFLNTAESIIEKENDSIKEEFYVIARPDLKVAAILDEFSYECFKYECNLILLEPDNWENTLMNEKPDLLLVESAWNGNNGKWKFKITDLHQKQDNTLRDLIKWCKENHIPTVFWNKEDPVNFEHFIEAAKQFDYIFTTDFDCIPKYKEVVGHENIFPLPFAAQPRIHNPVDKDKEKLGQVAFAGTWYEKRHPDRKKDMENLLKPALKYDLHIYDRMYNYTKSDYYKFPDIYQPYIKGCLPYDQMVSTYKKYDVFLNVNSVQNSPTMFSRRVFELLACGINVISGYSVGIERMFDNIVKLSKSEEDTMRYLDILLRSKELRDRLSLIGQREVFNNHTYRHRIEVILDKIGLSYKKKEIPGVSIITCTNRPNYMNNVFENYERQNYENKELIVILNNNNMSLKEWREKAKQYKNVKVFQLDESKSLGECINFAIDQSSMEYISKFDDDNYYAPNFTRDIMNAFKYTDAGIVGKCTYYAYLEGKKILALRFPNQENRYVKFLSGSAMIIKREIFNKIRFPEKSVGEDTKFLKDCVENGIKLYSIDRYNYVVMRHASIEDHTWKIEDDEYLRKCEIVCFTDDYKSHVTV